MRRSFEAMGGTVRTDAEVVQIGVREGGVTSVALAGGLEFHAPIVLSNLNPKTTFLQLLEPEHLSAGFGSASSS